MRRSVIIYRLGSSTASEPRLYVILNQVSEGPRRAEELGVVFDMDGVLLDSTPCHRQAFIETLAPLGIIDFSYPRFAGWRTPDVFRTLFEQAGLSMTEQQIAECAKQKSARSRALLDSQHTLFTACVPAVEKLATTYPLAIASSGSRSSVHTFLEKSGLRKAFRVVVSGDDVTHAKPNPEIFVRAIAGLALTPQQCVVVEDAEAGVKAACSAGAVAFAYGDDADGLLTRAGARCVVRDLSELPSLLEGLRLS